jgi:Bifunctional DNA primase/polymerase, N-terminal
MSGRDTSREALRDGLPLRGALWAASKGWRVFPIRPTAKKPPAVASWETRATADPGQVRRWWRAAPYNAGIACGPSGLVVVDLDVPKPGEAVPAAWAGCADGAAVLAALCERHGQSWPDTLTVTTRRGGLHLYFTAPAGVRLGNTAGGLGWLIDTRAHGGYVVAPGSIVEAADGTGRYEFASYRPAAELPAWLARLITAPPPSPLLGARCPAPTRCAT